MGSILSSQVANSGFSTGRGKKQREQMQGRQGESVPCLLYIIVG